MSWAPSRPRIGGAYRGNAMRVVDIDNPAKKMTVEERCELMYKGPMNCFGNQQGTKETVEVDGWLHTGDVATMDDGAKILNRVYKRNAIKVRPVRPRIFDTASRSRQW